MIGGNQTLMRWGSHSEMLQACCCTTGSASVIIAVSSDACKTEPVPCSECKHAPLPHALRQSTQPSQWQVAELWQHLLTKLFKRLLRPEIKQHAWSKEAVDQDFKC